MPIFLSEKKDINLYLGAMSFIHRPSVPSPIAQLLGFDQRNQCNFSRQQRLKKNSTNHYHHHHHQQQQKQHNKKLFCWCKFPSDYTETHLYEVLVCPQHISAFIQLKNKTFY